MITLGACEDSTCTVEANWCRRISCSNVSGCVSDVICRVPAVPATLREVAPTGRTSKVVAIMSATITVPIKVRRCTGIKFFRMLFPSILFMHTNICIFLKHTCVPLVRHVQDYPYGSVCQKWVILHTLFFCSQGMLLSELQEDFCERSKEARLL